MSSNLTDLVILRHGEAGYAQRDNDRRLTETGQKQINSQYQWLTAQGYDPELILHSPYRRTCETASLANQYFPDAVLQTEPLLTPDADPALASAFINTLESHRILVVSHMPMVACLTSIYLPETEIFGYPVAGLCWLQMIPDENISKLLYRHWCYDRE